MTGNSSALEGDGATLGDGSDSPIELTIQQASRLLDVPAPTIRSWERRYGVPSASRSQGGHRRYSPDQLDLVRRMRDLVAQGRQAADAAAQVKAERDTSPGPLIEGFLRAAHTLQTDGIEEILDHARLVLGLDRTVDEILLPAMRQIGQRWEAGLTDVGHEHLATHAALTWLAKVDRTVPPPVAHHPIILSCGPEDHHTIGLEALGALLRQRGWDCRILGARTPVESLSRAVRETSAVAVVVVCHLSPGRQAAVTSLRSIALGHTKIFYAGAAFSSRQSRHGVPGRYLGNNFAAAADLIAVTVLAARTGAWSPGPGPVDADAHPAL